MSERAFTQSDLALILTKVAGVIGPFDILDLAARQDGVYLSLRRDDHGEGVYASVVLGYDDLLGDSDALILAQNLFDETVTEEARLAAEQAKVRQAAQRAADKRRRARAKATRTKREIALLHKLAAKYPSV